ncbi:MAG: hypothetical protein K2X77_11275 [Candidatus Obscuribacterales bacterium]|nr:hypothetical protein [Candidatus Obscuribacterales bacterium]
MSFRYLLSVSLSLPICLSFTLAATELGYAPTSASSHISLQSPMVTGNGFGYAVLSPEGRITKLYAHPYRFERPNPDESKDGFETTNFLQSLRLDLESVGFTHRSQDPGINRKDNCTYLRESNILSVARNDFQEIYFMPFGLHENVFVAGITGAAGTSGGKHVLYPKWKHALVSDELRHTLPGRKGRLLHFKGVKESLLAVPLDRSTDLARSSATELPGAAWAFITLENAKDADLAVERLNAWQGKLSLDALIEREIAEHEKWRVKPNVTFRSDDEKKLWRQNETFLRMSQIQEANTAKRFSNGLILASLPDGMWFTPWVRDMAYAVVGLIKMGHLEEAKKGLLSWFNSRPVGKWKRETRNLDYQISVTRYFGDGSEEADYSGLKTPNVEFDDWGLALWAVAEYFEKTKDFDFLNTKTYRGCTVYECMKDFIVTPLFGNLDKFDDGLIVTADSSLWEEHQENKKHFAFSTFSNIKGLRGFLKIAEAMKDRDEVKRVSEKLALIEKGFQSAFVHDGVVWGVAVEPCPKSEIDGSLLEAFNMGIVTDPAVRDKTLQKMELLKTASGGYRRLLGPSDYEKQEFVFIDFHMARVLQSIGRKVEAQQMIDRIVNKSLQDHGLIAECYVSEKSNDFKGEIGDPTGSIPMIGYGAGIYAMTLAEREALASQ